MQFFWTEREGLQHIEFVMGILGVVEESLGVEAKWIYKILVVVIDGPLPRSDESLANLSAFLLSYELSLVLSRKLNLRPRE
jgi:hypothetical protein